MPSSEPFPATAARTFHAEFGLGELVYLRARAGKLAGMVTNVEFFQHGCIYIVSWGHGGCDKRYGIELTREYSPDFSAEG